MKSAIFASAALVAGAAATGSAIVINKCNYPVYLANTPASGGGYTEIDETLATNGQYTQQWTELSNLDGWSIKLSNSSTNWSNILQYEYTYLNDGTIWYDLSEVNGNPWNGDWEITSDTSACAPKQQAYRYATDDAYGEQSCPDSSTITVTLCSGESQDDGAASSLSSSVAAHTTTVAKASSTAAASTTHAVTTTAAAATTVKSATPTSSLITTTTLQTSVITSVAASSDVVVTVTNVAYTTEWTHHWGGPSKRDAHHQHHAHMARHPHARE